MTLGDFHIIEEILSLYPEICLQAEIRRDWLFNKALNHEPGVKVQGGGSMTPGERFVEHEDKALINMDLIRERIEGALIKLRAEEKAFVQRYYFDNDNDFDVCQQVLYRQRKQIAEKISGPVLAVYDNVRTFRARQAEQRTRARQKKWSPV